MAGSEVARLLQRIRQEEEAAQRALNGYAIVGRHEFITKHMENMDFCVNALAKVVGSEEVAMDLIIANQIQRESNTSDVAL
jgi:hypothetical protein